MELIGNPSSSGAGRLRSNCRDGALLPGHKGSCDSGVFGVNAEASAGLVSKARCRLMWPPSACPDEYSAPQIRHSWSLGSCFPLLLVLSHDFFLVFIKWRGRAPSSSEAETGDDGDKFFLLMDPVDVGGAILGFLWLALCPPRAWNEGKTLSQVLHWYTDSPVFRNLLLLNLLWWWSSLFASCCSSSSSSTDSCLFSWSRNWPLARSMRQWAMSSSSLISSPRVTSEDSVEERGPVLLTFSSWSPPGDPPTGKVNGDWPLCRFVRWRLGKGIRPLGRVVNGATCSRASMVGNLRLDFSFFLCTEYGWWSLEMVREELIREGLSGVDDI